jgi:hypothetical protein
MKVTGGVKTNEDFLILFRQKLKEMEQKIQGIEIGKAKLKIL